MRALLVVAILAIASPALADPPPAVVEPMPPAAAQTVTVKRETLELIMAEAATAGPTRELLLDCQADAARLAKQEEPASTWWSGLKWAGVGALVIGAFAAGVWVGH